MHREHVRPFHHAEYLDFLNQKPHRLRLLNRQIGYLDSERPFAGYPRRLLNLFLCRQP